ncbi:MAG TPA: glutamyl-tRNA reductase [Planctomycetaceae bacterium]|nr:glutamyl-tRNA reductase [Planctomycetaceae bacterium]HRF00284.1 glutamyl-tRNA reductase [Pirellulaceae bacterium]
MKVVMVGCSHKETSIAVRERLAFSPEQVRDALVRHREKYPRREAVLLSTCNRTEFYVAGDDPEDEPSADQAIAFLAECRDVAVEAISDELTERVDIDAVMHLFRVAASLDSMVVGEAQILSQVKQAYEASCDVLEAMPISHAVFQRAIRTAKRIASETRIHERRISVPSVAISDLATQIFERFDDKNILVIGAGEMAEETLTYLAAQGAKRIRLVNRSRERAEKLAAKFGATVHPWEELIELLADADMVISTTGATEPIVTLERYRSIERRREQRILFVLDLAIPRDFDPAIGDCLNVYLYSVDDLQAQCDKNLRARKKELPKAERIVEDEAKRFLKEAEYRASAGTIRQLKEKADELKGIELERLFNRLEGLDERERKEIRYAFDRLVAKILHPPLESLRDDAAEPNHSSLIEAVRRLFQLRD